MLSSRTRGPPNQLAMIARLAVLLVLLAPLPVRADEPYDVDPERPYFVRALHKLGRGALNALVFPTEIPLNSIEEWQIAEVRGGGPYDQVSGGLYGLLTGTAYGVVRAGVAVFDVATFFVPTGPVMSPATPTSLYRRVANAGCEAPPQDRRVCND
jgi:putative exosortase-associated protein (TIGR04073 family)